VINIKLQQQTNTKHFNKYNTLPRELMPNFNHVSVLHINTAQNVSFKIIIRNFIVCTSPTVMGSNNTCYLSFIITIGLLFSYNTDTVHAARNLNLMPAQTYPGLTVPKDETLPKNPLPVPELPEVDPWSKGPQLKDPVVPILPKYPIVPIFPKPKVLPILPKPTILPKLPFGSLHFPLFPKIFSIPKRLIHVPHFPIGPKIP
jgi:hypothetical protein